MDYKYKIKKIKNKEEINEANLKGAKSYFELYLLKNHLNLSVPETEIDKINSLVNGIFGENSFSDYRTRSKLSVIYPSKFERYSAYKLLDGNLSEIEFSKARTLAQDEFNSKKTEWIKSGLESPLISRFQEIRKFDNREDFEKVINAIFYLANHKPLNTTMPNRTLIGYDGDDLLNKLSNYRNELIDKYYPEENGKQKFESFVNELFKKAISPFLFESDFIRYLNNRLLSVEGQDIFPVAKDELNKLAINYFKRYSQEIAKLDNNFWTLFHNCKQANWVALGGGSYRKEKEIQLKEANEIMIDFITNKDLNGFLLSMIQTSDHRGKYFYIYDLCIDLFGSWKKFKDFIYSQDEQKWNYLKEFKSLFSLVEAKNFQQGVEFNFTTIPINNKK